MSYIYNIVVPFKNDGTIESSVTGVEARSCLSADTSLGWTNHVSAALGAGVVIFKGVNVGDMYSIQLRYTSNNGFAGPWSEEVTHTVVGQIFPPSNVSSDIRIVPEGSMLRITWSRNLEPNIAGYEVRDVQAEDGSAGAIYSGNGNTCLVSPGPLNIPKTWYIKAYSGNNLYSLTSANVTFMVAAPFVPTNITSKYTGNNTALFKWTASLPGSFPVRNYRLSLTGIGLTTITATRDTTDWEIPVTWVNAVTLLVVPVDDAGYAYIGQNNTTTLFSGVPTTPAAPTITVVGTNIEIDIPDPVVGSAQTPIASYELRDEDTGELVWKSSV